MVTLVELPLLWTTLKKIVRLTSSPRASVFFVMLSQTMEKPRTGGMGSLAREDNVGLATWA